MGWLRAIQLFQLGCKIFHGRTAPIFIQSRCPNLSAHGGSRNAMISRLQEMIPASIEPWVVPTCRTVRRRLNQLDRAIDRRRLSETAFIALLREIGFTNGATVLVHSSM